MITNTRLSCSSKRSWGQRFLLLFILFWFSQAEAAFVVRDIKVEGNQRISYGTVLNYLPIKVGETYTSADSIKIIRSLYQTGFFEKIDLAQSGNTLIVKVVERPIISSINISGNSDISTDTLKEALKNVNIVDGSVYDPSTLDKLKKALQEQYYSSGKYSATIDTQAVEEDRNRVVINIFISEGEIAKISQIKFIGNEVFDDGDLLSHMTLSEPSLWTWAKSFFDNSNQYSKEALDASLKEIQTYYMDNGYIQMQLDSTQVSITPDKKQVYIVVKISEGSQFTLSGFDIAGQLMTSKDKLEQLVKLKQGKIFSRKDVLAASNAITEYYGNIGYAFAQVRVQPDIDEETKEVFVTFFVTPGQRIYVREIIFSGNHTTADSVLRRAMRQNESALLSMGNIKASERQLRQLPYLGNVSTKLPLVPGKSDQVDARFEVEEKSSAQLTFGVGVSDTNGLLLNAGFNQSNFLGTGKQVGVNFTNNSYERLYDVYYNNPYYTQDGISRGFRGYVQQLSPNQVNITNYSSENIGGQVFYRIPMSDFHNINVGFGYEHIRIKEGSSVSDEIKKFTDDHGKQYDEAQLTVGWSQKTYDQVIFPREGLSQALRATLSAPLTSNSLGYYKAEYSIRYYLPLNKSKSFILSLRGQAGYGDGVFGTKELPFFENYFAGGTGTVRGYEGNALGPHASEDGVIDDDKALGGDIILNGSVELIFPNFVDPDTLRTSVFVDFGNVFNTNINRTGVDKVDRGGFDLGDMAYTAGIAVAWRVPMLGPLEVSLAVPIGEKKGPTEVFQFNIGTSF